MSDTDADAVLVDRVKRGDVRAFEMLVVKYQRRIERLIGRMVRDVDLVLDTTPQPFDVTVTPAVLEAMMLAVSNARTQEELRASRARFDRLSEAGILGIVVGTLDRRIAEVNDALVVRPVYHSSRWLVWKAAHAWDAKLPEKEAIKATAQAAAFALGKFIGQMARLVKVGIVVHGSGIYAGDRPRGGSETAVGIFEGKGNFTQSSADTGRFDGKGQQVALAFAPRDRKSVV